MCCISKYIVIALFCQLPILQIGKDSGFRIGDSGFGFIVIALFCQLPILQIGKGSGFGLTNNRAFFCEF
jgi:hypothetical protein